MPCETAANCTAGEMVPTGNGKNANVSPAFVLILRFCLSYCLVSL